MGISLGRRAAAPCTHIYRSKTLCAYVCVFDGFRARSSTTTQALSFLVVPPLLADMKAKQSNQILIGWNSSGSAGTKNKSLVGWLVGVVRVFCA